MKTSNIVLLWLMVAWTTHTGYSQQRESYDIVSYSIPAGWKKEILNSGVSYTATDNRTGEWCVIAIYKSMASTGSLATDFDHEWNDLIAKPYNISRKSTPELVTQGGWSVQSMAGNFTWQNRESIILLNVITGYGHLTSITVSMNGSVYKTEAEGFLDSIEMIKNTYDSSPSDKSTQPSSVSNRISGSGITKNTTLFDDGWTAQVMNDYVLVTKENTKFYMHHGFSIPANSGAGERATTQENWDKFITPRYNITNLWLNPDVGSWGGSFNYYAEGNGTEISTGQSVFIGFRTIIEGGAYFCVEAVAPTKEAYLKHFPNLDMLKAMRNSNRFAITREDVMGDWSSSSSSALQYYNVYTGQSAGMQGTQSDESFSFEASGEYNAKLSGIMGTLGGAQTYYDGKYNGQFITTDWEMTLTNYGKVTQVFTCYFEAVRGGRILHIAKKDAPGVHYALIKAK